MENGFSLGCFISVYIVVHVGIGQEKTRYNLIKYCGLGKCRMLFFCRLYINQLGLFSLRRIAKLLSLRRELNVRNDEKNVLRKSRSWNTLHKESSEYRRTFDILTHNVQ